MGTNTKVLATLAVAAVFAFALTATVLAGSASTELVSVSSSDEPGNDSSFSPAVSADGRYVAFTSDASNLVAADTNGDADVFVRDRVRGTTQRVSASSTGQQGNRDSARPPAISADGRYVAFASDASNLIAGDTNSDLDVFVRDRVLGTTERVSISSSGHEGNKDSWEPTISANGRYVAFTSKASNLVSHDTNFDDVFVRDRKLDTTKRASVSSTERQARRPSFAPSISYSGRYVAFTSRAPNLVPRDTTGVADVFVRDRERHVTRRVSVSSSGRQGGGSSDVSAISANGRYVAFGSRAANLVARDTNNGVTDVFVRDRERDKTRRVSVSSSGREGNKDSWEPAISANGRYVAFRSRASNLGPGDTNGLPDVFVRDRKRDETRGMSVSSAGRMGNSDSWDPAISADGGYVAFYSLASNLVAGDTNRVYDVFVRGPLP